MHVITQQSPRSAHRGTPKGLDSLQSAAHSNDALLKRGTKFSPGRSPLLVLAGARGAADEPGEVLLLTGGRSPYWRVPAHFAPPRAHIRTAPRVERGLSPEPPAEVRTLKRRKKGPRLVNKQSYVALKAADRNREPPRVSRLPRSLSHPARPLFVAPFVSGTARRLPGFRRFRSRSPGKNWSPPWLPSITR
jgi:hypothetical protein